MNITKLSPVFGAEIDGVDLSTIGDGDFEQVYRAWVEYGVLRFRGQKLGDAKLEAFSARFCPLEAFPLRLTPEQEMQIPSLYVLPFRTSPSTASRSAASAVAKPSGTRT